MIQVNVPLLERKVSCARFGETLKLLVKDREISMGNQENLANLLRRLCCLKVWLPWWFRW